MTIEEKKYSIIQQIGVKMAKGGEDILKGSFNFSYTPLSKEQLDTVFRALVPTSKSNWFFDNTYQTVSYNDLIKVLEIDWTNERQYIADIRDCEDFAFQLKARLNLLGITAVGIAIGMLNHRTLHAFNIFVSNNRKVYIIEPQEKLKIAEWNTPEIKLGSNSYEIQQILI